MEHISQLLALASEGSAEKNLNRSNDFFQDNHLNNSMQDHIWNQLLEYLNDNSISDNCKTRNVSKIFGDGGTVLHSVRCNSESVTIVKKILEFVDKSSLLRCDRFGWTLLHRACCRNPPHFEIIELLIDIGEKKLLVRQDKWLATALHYLTRIRKAESDSYEPLTVALSDFLSIGGKEMIMLQDTDGNTAVHVLCQYMDCENHPLHDFIKETIFICGYDLFMLKNKGGKSFLDLLITNKKIPLCERNRLKKIYLDLKENEELKFYKASTVRSLRERETYHIVDNGVLEERHASVKAENKALINNLEMEKSRNDTLETKLKKAQLDIEFLQRQQISYYALNKKHTDMQLKYEALRKKHMDVEMVSKIDLLKKERSKILEENDVLKKKQADVVDMNDFLTKKLDDTMSENRRLKKERSDMQSEIDVLKKERIDFRIEYDSLKKKQVDMHANHNAIKQDKIDLTAKIEAQKLKQADMNEEINTLKKELIVFQSQIRLLERNSYDSSLEEGLTNRDAEVHQRIEELNRHNSKLTEQVIELQGIIDDIKDDNALLIAQTECLRAEKYNETAVLKAQKECLKAEKDIYKNKADRVQSQMQNNQLKRKSTNDTFAPADEPPAQRLLMSSVSDVFDG